jgi:hypothetical protein
VSYSFIANPRELGNTGMSGLELKYDGVVYQHTGELLLDLAVTSDLRRMCPESYWRSLQVFTFGQVFAAHLITLGREENGATVANPMVPLYDGGPRPGEMLLSECFPTKRRPKLPSGALPTSEELIKDPADSGKIKEALCRLKRLDYDSDDAMFWRQHMVREAYFGFQPIGQKNGHWEFSTRENFTYDESKEREIPLDFVENMRAHVASTLREHLKTRNVEALPSYIRRNVVAHLAIHPVSNSRNDPDFDNRESSARIFHATRDFLARDEADQELWNIHELTVPGLLKNMIKKAAREAKPSRRREVLIKMIQDASLDQDGGLGPLRDKLAEAVAQARNGNDNTDLKNLRRDLQDLSSRIGATEEPRIILVGAERYRDAISVLAKMGAGPQDQMWSPEFNKVFPELVPQHQIHVAQQ